ncbi:MAG: hypothetical protein K5664_07190 [Firmicutes bacterium]|nr:hypothetical protein [Bacillota bacterium]
MNFEKTAKSFEKHFAKSCEKICFAGMPLSIISSKEISLSAALSVGGCAAVARRGDGRFNAEFDDNVKYITSNVIDIEYHKKEPMLGFLARAESLGATLGGADIVFEYNTNIYNEYETLLLSCMYLFCNKMPDVKTAKNCLNNPNRDFASIVGVKDRILMSANGKYTYIKFSDSAVKIVLCHIRDKNYIKECNDNAVKTAAESLAMGDYLHFGEIITHEHYENAKAGKASKEAFRLAVKLKDALGCGFLENGGIFAIVENAKVNAFVQNMKKEYATYYGASPDFYITCTENSGVNKVIDKKDL